MNEITHMWIDDDFHTLAEWTVLKHCENMGFASSAMWMFGYVRHADGGYVKVTRYGSAREAYFTLTGQTNEANNQSTQSVA